jgi:hypothetical protein
MADVAEDVQRWAAKRRVALMLSVRDERGFAPFDGRQLLVQQLVVRRVVQADVAHVVVASSRCEANVTLWKTGRQTAPLHGTLAAMDELRLDVAERSGHGTPPLPTGHGRVSAKDSDSLQARPTRSIHRCVGIAWLAGPGAPFNAAQWPAQR